MEQRYAKILGTGIYLPEKIVTNEELSARLGYDVSQYLSGITLRHVSAPDESASDLAVKAAQDVMKKTGVKPEDLDLVIMTTDSPDYVTPPTSPAIAWKLGAVNAGAFDVNGACADAVIGMSIACQHIMMDPTINTVLVVAPYAMTKWLDWDNKVLAPMLGDGRLSGHHHEVGRTRLHRVVDRCGRTVLGRLRRLRRNQVPCDQGDGGQERAVPEVPSQLPQVSR